MKTFALLCVLAFAVATVSADIYLHNPRGSNNRLDEANRDRQNGNRLFDSQNNNRGGYNAGSLYYYEGSKAYFEWTQQHSCGSANAHCELVLQYMCDDRLRDGSTTNRIPTNQEDCFAEDCDIDPEYGRQESYDWYRKCMDTSRNKGLFTANQDINGDSAQYTRQNPNANRQGYECPEERDYYPYWRPTPWRDVAIFTNEPQRCAAYQAESQNVKDRFECILPGNLTEIKREENRRGFIPINEEECLEMYQLDANGIPVFAQWQRVPSFGIAAPVCRQNQFARDNHHGNIEGGYPMMFNWTVPSEVIHERCVFRLRYNISTYDMEHWAGIDSVQAGSLNASANSIVNNNNPDDDRDPAEVAIYETFGLTRDEVAASFDRDTNNDEESLRASREYVLKNDPDVDIFGAILPTGDIGNLKLQMNVNTAQFGRTFQDRSHRFAIRSRPDSLAGAVIHNVNVRGKRGNIVQVYPGVEYDFVPNRLAAAKNEYVHFQWTGSNTNPNNNDGQGKAGTDRSNIVGQWGVDDADLIIGAEYGYGPTVFSEEGQGSEDLPLYGQPGTSFPADVTKKPFLGLDQEDILTLATLRHLGGEMSELDDSATYFELAPQKITQEGVFSYLCTRNNNFSNRSQKGRIIVSTRSTTTDVIGWSGGSVTNSAATIQFAEGAVTSAVEITIASQPATEEELDDGIASNFVSVYPMDLPATSGSSVYLTIPYDDTFSVTGHTVNWYPDGNTAGSAVDVSEATTFEDSKAVVKVSEGGTYVVRSDDVDWVAAIFLSLLGVVVVAAAVVGGIKYKRGTLPCQQNKYTN